jgi:hypothetical protein
MLATAGCNKGDASDQGASAAIPPAEPLLLAAALTHPAEAHRQHAAEMRPGGDCIVDPAIVEIWNTTAQLHTLAIDTESLFSKLV